MSSPIIKVENLCKDYTISHQGSAASYQTLRESVTGWFKNQSASGGSEIFHALKDVSFEVQQGEVLGIIGRNGAGKSTLLKILSRITEPTAGKITIRGRVASLLEVGTGFHPELTGRENIFLNGAILGMTRAEIKKKFDEIVDFSGVEKFLDTPVKRYSSGMYVRLAFAVAAHLEPEILIVDEVLAVGDVAFQQKCLGKMKDVSASEGRTVLFVSHNLAAVRQLCSRALLLEKGSLTAHGSVHSILSAYGQSMEEGAPLAVPRPTPDLLERAYTSALRLETLDGGSLSFARVGESWRVRLRITVCQPLKEFVASVGLVTSEGIGLQTVWSAPAEMTPGDYEYVFTQTEVALAADSYKLIVGLSAENRSIQQFEATRVEITGENPLIVCPATSGYGLVLNSMQVSMDRI